MATKKVVLADLEHCTGCGACANICHKNAIIMRADSEGFLQPTINNELCIRCGQCEKVCPVLHPQYNNMSVNTCYAMWSDDEIRKITSTAGFFFLAAKHILQQGGKAYGAAWTSQWGVHHIGIEQIEDLKLLTGSKYLQSDVENSYRQVQTDLKNGRKVLFSGCPCQIAGLYGFLGDNKSENLFTVEVICHGVPSPKAFHKYLNDNFKDKIIKQIDFRDKTIFHWSTTANIYFDDGTVYRKNEHQDTFYRAFLPCLILRRSCANCAFSKLPRQADISMGDFWGIESTAADWNDRKGTELLLINNMAGKKLFTELKPEFKRIQEFPLETALKVNKTIVHPFRSHPGRKHFFSSMGLKPFNQLVDAALEHKYDIGIVGLWYGINYGSILTYYALYQLLKELGYDPVMLPKPNNMWEDRFNRPDTIAQKFIWKHCNVFNPCQVQEEYLRMNDRCKDFIVGSDVVWNYDICVKQSDQFFFLDWVESGHKKIAYAASFGNGLTGDRSYVEKAKYHLKKFHYISVRESLGVKAATVDCRRDDIVHVLDPVFICNYDIYENAIKESNLNEKEPIVFAYILRKSMFQQKLQLIDYACQYYNAQSRICGNPNEMENSKKLYKERLLPLLTVEEWLYYIKNCSMYIGDSYHALCFCLIFHKPFIIIYGRSDYAFSGERFYSLLSLVGLENRILESLENPDKYKELVSMPIDWDKVDKKISDMKSYSYRWLKNALVGKVAMPTPQEYIRDQEKRQLYEWRIRQLELERKLANQETEKADYMEEKAKLYASNSWRVGRAITWIPRKIKRWFDPYKKQFF